MNSEWQSSSHHSGPSASSKLIPVPFSIRPIADSIQSLSLLEVVSESKKYLTVSEGQGLPLPHWSCAQSSSLASGRSARSCSACTNSRNSSAVRML